MTPVRVDIATHGAEQFRDVLNFIQYDQSVTIGLKKYIGLLKLCPGLRVFTRSR